VAFQLRPGLVVVFGRREQLLQRSRVNSLGKMRAQLLRRRIEQIDPLGHRSEASSGVGWHVPTR